MRAWVAIPCARPSPREAKRLVRRCRPGCGDQAKGRLLLCFINVTGVVHQISSSQCECFAFKKELLRPAGRTSTGLRFAFEECCWEQRELWVQLISCVGVPLAGEDGLEGPLCGIYSFIFSVCSCFPAVFDILVGHLCRSLSLWKDFRCRQRDCGFR